MAMGEATPSPQKRPRPPEGDEQTRGPKSAIPSVRNRRTVETPHHGTISYLEAGASEGSGTPSGRRCTTVLFLHGIQGNASSFRSQLEYLSRALRAPNRILAMDLPGYGETRGLPPPPDAAKSPRASTVGNDDAKGPKADRIPLHGASFICPYYAEAVGAFLDALSVPRLSMLVGHSMGGIVAQLFADSMPHRLDRLVVSSSYVGDGRSERDALDSKWTKRMDDLRNLSPDQYGSARARGMVADPDSPKSAAAVEELARIASEVTEEGLRGGCNLLHVSDTSDALRRIGSMGRDGSSSKNSSTKKVLVLVGEKDEVVTPARSRRVEEILLSSLPFAGDVDASAGNAGAGGVVAVRCRTVELMGVAHASYLEDADAYNETLTGFLES